MSRPSAGCTRFAWNRSLCRLTAAKRAFRQQLVHSGAMCRHQALDRQRLPNALLDGPRPSVPAKIINTVAGRLPR